jgi:D-threonate/D-erythronate kinase
MKNNIIKDNKNVNNLPESKIKLLIIADDFTGALDTGVKFAASGAQTKVTTDIKNNFADIDADSTVLVIDAGTRHSTPQIAYSIIYSIVQRAKYAGIPYIFKKTDSALRGNIGSELTAVLKASNQPILPFFPAFPAMSRTTLDGIQFLDGIPIDKSIFGQDPYEPVKLSYIPDIIKQQSDISARVIRLEDPLDNLEGKGIFIFDSKTDDDLCARTKSLYKRHMLRILAGCAGLAGILPGILGLKSNPPSKLTFRHPLLVICGSINEITKTQLDYAETHGFTRITLTPEQKLEPEFLDSSKGKELLLSLIAINANSTPLIIDTNDEANGTHASDYIKKYNLSPEQVRIRISNTLGRISQALVDFNIKGTLLITGGDTLISFIQQIGCREINPRYEVEPGVVYSELLYKERILPVISKSGGFGSKNLLVNLMNK